MRRNRHIPLSICLILHMSNALTGQTQTVDRCSLIEDIRQLSGILESSHPDPYIRGGGKIAYHRRLQELILSIPEEGMTIKAFQNRLLVKPILYLRFFQFPRCSTEPRWETGLRCLRGLLLVPLVQRNCRLRSFYRLRIPLPETKVLLMVHAPESCQRLLSPHAL